MTGAERCGHSQMLPKRPKGNRLERRTEPGKSTRPDSLDEQKRRNVRFRAERRSPGVRTGRPRAAGERAGRRSGLPGRIQEPRIPRTGSEARAPSRWRASPRSVEKGSADLARCAARCPPRDPLGWPAHSGSALVLPGAGGCSGRTFARRPSPTSRERVGAGPRPGQTCAPHAACQASAVHQSTPPESPSVPRTRRRSSGSGAARSSPDPVAGCTSPSRAAWRKKRSSPGWGRPP